MSPKNKNSDYNDNFEGFGSDGRDIYSSSKGPNSRMPRRSVNSKKLRKRKIIFACAIILSAVVGLIGGAMIYTYRMLDSLNYQPIQDGGTEYVAGSACDPMILNVALFGVDRHEESDVHSRSDSILILSLDSRHKKIKLTSLMRDLWVHIPGYKDNRINAAIALGGESLAIKTIEQNFGIKIDRFCTVDFEGFRDIIDIIGGLDMEITAKEAHHINRLLLELDSAFIQGGIKPFKSPLLKEVDGMHHLNGAQSLQYARSRKVPTAEGLHDDYARTFRQRRVISLLINKFKSSSLPQILAVIEKAGPYVRTNLKKSEIITLGKNSLKYLQYEFVEFRIPQDGNFSGQNINGAAVLVIDDLIKARYELAKFIYEDSVKERSYSKARVRTPASQQNAQPSTQTTAANSSSNSSSAQPTAASGVSSTSSTQRTGTNRTSSTSSTQPTATSSANSTGSTQHTAANRASNSASAQPTATSRTNNTNATQRTTANSAASNHPATAAPNRSRPRRTAG